MVVYKHTHRSLYFSHVFNESLKNEISQWGLQKINYVDFLGIENFLSNFSKENLNICFSMWEEIFIFHGQKRILILRRVNL
jgi:hypothetical protein